MTPLLRLGVRLAGGGGPPERVRAASVVLASAIGCWLLLNTFAIAAAESVLRDDLFAATEMQRLLAAVVAAIVMPVLVLTATASRLSATLRDRRLASLRLLGLSPRQTRVVAATEVGATAVLGTALGVLLFWLTRPVVSGLQVAGRDWSSVPFQPAPWSHVAVVVGVPLATVVVSLIPTRGLGRSILGSQVHDQRPSAWRAAPLAGGLLLLTWAVAGAQPEGGSSPEFYAFFIGTILTALGVLLVVPIFVPLVAEVALRVSSRPTVRIAARRLQSQPAGMTRVVAGLLVGLFVIAGARGVVTAWETTPQYVRADQSLHHGPQVLDVSVRRIASADAAAALERAPGVRDVVPLRNVTTRCTVTGPCMQALVGTCAEVATLAPDAVGCRDDAVTWIRAAESMPGSDQTFTWLPTRRHGPPPTLTLPAPDSVIYTDDPVAALQAGVFIPISTPGIQALIPERPDFTVLAGPGAEVAQDIERTVRGASVFSQAAPEDYYFVAGLRALVWSVAAVILSVGLLAFAISAVDRAIGRRREIVSLQLVGVPPRTLRATQWYESLLPLVLGLPMAIGLGWWAGSAFLALGDELNATPWRSVTGLAGVSVVGALIVAGLTVIAASPRIRADLIRRE